MLIDASFGFEMETFEFLNICQVHGFPRIMGVLTHLDSFKNNKTLRKTKKNLKHRFWTEVYQVKLGIMMCSWRKLMMVSNEISSVLYLNYSGGQVVLFVWNGVWRVSNSGSEEPWPLHLCHEVPSSGVADLPSLYSSGPVSDNLGFLTLVKADDTSIKRRVQLLILIYYGQIRIQNKYSVQ